MKLIVTAQRIGGVWRGVVTLTGDGPGEVETMYSQHKGGPAAALAEAVAAGEELRVAFPDIEIDVETIDWSREPRS